MLDLPKAVAWAGCGSTAGCATAGSSTTGLPKYVEWQAGVKENVLFSSWGSSTGNCPPRRSGVAGRQPCFKAESTSSLHCSYFSGQGVFFLLWLLFARAPCLWFLENFLLSSPGVQSFFFFVAPCWAPRPFGGPGQKKHHPGCVFFCSDPGERQGKEKPRWVPARGQSKKKHPGWLFFCSGPAERSRRLTGRNKKKNFAHPETTAKTVVENKDTGHEQKGATTKKKTTHSLRPWTAMLTHFFSGATFPAGAFFFCCGPARTLTHPLRSWAAMPPAGVVFFFLLRPRPDRGGFFFLLWPRPDAHSLTVRWGDFGKALVIFFCCGPAEPGEPITKNVW